jgi:hypothetical protein
VTIVRSSTYQEADDERAAADLAPALVDKAQAHDLHGMADNRGD